MEKLALIDRIDFSKSDGEGWSVDDIIVENEFWRRNDAAGDVWEKIVLQFLAADSRYLGLDAEGRAVFAQTKHFLTRAELYRYLMESKAFDPQDPYAALAKHCTEAVKIKAVALALSPDGLKKASSWLSGLFQGV